MSPVLKPPSLEVKVWTTWSSLVTVTVAPGFTVMVPGEKAKLWMVIESVARPVVDGELDAEWVVGLLVEDAEHAARVNAIPAKITSNRRLGIPET